MVAAAVKIIIILIMCLSASQCLQEKCKLFTCSLQFSPNFPLLSDFCQLSNDLNFVLVLLRFN